MLNRKILHVVSVSFSLRYFVGNQFYFFRNKGYEFHVACSDSEELLNLAEEYGFKPFPLPVLRSVSPIQDLKSIEKLRKYIIKNEIDIVVSHTPKGGMIGVLASYFAGSSKRIYFRHGLVFETATGLKKWLLINIERLVGIAATQVVNVSPSVAAVSQKHRLNPVKKKILLGKGTCNGIDVERFKCREGYKDGSVITIGFVGRLSIDKGIVPLVEAWELLAKEYGNIRLLLVGPFDGRDKLDDSIVFKIKNETSIEYVGEVDDTSLYYNRMDIFILPSFREGFPTVTLEASASKLPIITTRVTGCIDSIVENVTGIFSETTVPALVEAVKYYLDNEFLRKEHGNNGRAFVVNNFSEALIYEEIEKKLLS